MRCHQLLFAVLAIVVQAWTCALPVRADELTLAGVFGDHMVLQREKPVPVWGRAKPSSRVVVEFAGQSRTATADVTGRWRVELDAMPADAIGRAFVVRQPDDAAEVKLDDVLVGDVWLCSGQSNMAFRMNRTANAKAEIAAANQPQIRFLRVTQRFASAPAASSEGTWQAVTPQTAEECSAVAYYFARALREKHDVPIGLVVSAVGGTRIETWMRRETLVRVGVSDNLLEKWKDVTPDQLAQIDAAYAAFQHERDVTYWEAVRAAKAASKPVPPEPKPPAMRPHDCPGTLHNGMIAPLQPYAVRGVLWYQGEANSGQGANYEKLLPALIADWRTAWGESLPFLFVQLPPFQGTHPAFRESQQRIWQSTPHTGMVVTLDVGDAKDVHPTQKQPVGERLALAARAISYGEAIEYSGPVFNGLTIQGNRAVVSFTHVGAGLVTRGGQLSGFTIAGADGKFVQAAAIIEGDTVIVTSPDVAKPVAVRYGWAHVPECNLFSKDGLPAGPFRTDTN